MQRLQLQKKRSKLKSVGSRATARGTSSSCLTGTGTMLTCLAQVTNVACICAGPHGRFLSAAELEAAAKGLAATLPEADNMNIDTTASSGRAIVVAEASCPQKQHCKEAIVMATSTVSPTVSPTAQSQPSQDHNKAALAGCARNMSGASCSADSNTYTGWLCGV